ncbi:MAG: hypothetical protein IKZ49_02945 [Alphaproteobacteria bacterium]|nr:hypothetical protein [Alphaproteobacteria bacterium]
MSVEKNAIVGNNQSLNNKKQSEIDFIKQNRPVNIGIIFVSISELSWEERQSMIEIIEDDLSGGLKFEYISKNEENCFRVVDIYDDAITFTEKMSFLGNKYKRQIKIFIKPKGFDPRPVIVLGQNQSVLWAECRELGDEYFVVSEAEKDKLYNVPFSRYGRNYPCYSAAHSACLCSKDLGFPDFTIGRHPYGPSWTAVKAEKNGWINPLKRDEEMNKRINEESSVCLISPYIYGKSKEVQNQAYKDMGTDLSCLGYVYKMVNRVNSNGYQGAKVFKVAVRNWEVDIFKQDMLALAKKYNQEYIMLQLAKTKSAQYYHTSGRKFGEIADPKPCERTKNPLWENAISAIIPLTKEEFDSLPNGLIINTGNHHISRQRLRVKLGLPQFSKKLCGLMII